jgi:micrococcal nuclease
MKRLFFIITTAILLSGCASRVISVYDGDTATVSTFFGKEKVRFYGIDAPEKKQDYGIQSRDNLRLLILGKDVDVDCISKDRYGRIVGKIYLDGKYINLEMVKAGSAWWYEDYAKKDYEFRDAETLAKKQKLGLWKNPEAIPPWKWRKKSKAIKQPAEVTK